jgi:hypothetical protein
MDSSITKLVTVYKSIWVKAIKEFNEMRLPALEKFWGRSYKEEMEHEGSTTVETTKSYSRGINNCIFRLVNKEIPSFTEHMTNGSDYKLGSILLEDKNSFGKGNSWAGNDCDKTSIHILKKFDIDDNGKITKVFIGIVDLSKCSSKWSGRSGKSNFTNLAFKNEDFDHIMVIVGKKGKSTKNLKFDMEQVYE